VFKAYQTLKSGIITLWKGLTPWGGSRSVLLSSRGLTTNLSAARFQECNGAKITVHVLYKTLDGEDIGVFDLSQAIFTAMQGYGFSRTSEAPIYSGGEIIDWQIHFDAPRFEDDGAKISFHFTP
jgi:hypothetical protein